MPVVINISLRLFLSLVRIMANIIEIKMEIINSGSELIILSVSILFIWMDELNIYPIIGKTDIMVTYTITTENVSAIDLK